MTRKALESSFLDVLRTVYKNGGVGFTFGEMKPADGNGHAHFAVMIATAPYGLSNGAFDVITAAHDAFETSAKVKANA